MAKELKPVALQMYSLREAAKKDFFGTLKQVAGMGYAGVELAGLHDKTPQEVRKVVEDLGMKVCAAHLGVPTKDTLQQTLDTAKALGIKYIVSGKGRDQFATAEGIKAVADLYRQGMDLVNPHGLSIVYHNHWWEMGIVDGQLGYDLMMKAAPCLFGELDIYWASNFGVVNVPQLLARYKARLPLLHIKDGPLVKDQPHTAVGAGKMDIAGCIAAMDPDATKWLIVELDACTTDMATAVRESCAYMTSKGLGKGRK